MNANLRNFALWVIIVLLLLALFTLFQNPGQRASSQDISFSQLLTEVDQGHVRDVVIQGPEIHGTFTNGSSFQTYAPSDPTLVKRLYDGKVSITAKPPGDNVPWFVSLLVSWLPVHRADRRVDFPVAADAGRRRQGDGLWQVARQDADRSAWPRHVRRRRRRRRGQAGSAGDRRIPARPRKVPAPRRTDSARRAAGRPSRHRQDADRARGRGRSQRAVLHHLGFRLRRDVRRRRRSPRPRHVRAGQEERALHHLHRRNRRGRPSSRRRSRRRQ